jgi:hypothetical protein
MSFGMTVLTAIQGSGLLVLLAAAARIVVG